MSQPLNTKGIDRLLGKVRALGSMGFVEILPDRAIDSRLDDV